MPHAHPTQYSALSTQHSSLTFQSPRDTIQRMLTHRIDGDGPPLVLLNGGLMTIASWDAIVARIGDRFRIIRCDFRGQLLTPGPFPSTLEEHANDVAEILDHLGIARAHVFGTSFGAEVAIALAAMKPERVITLIAATAVDRSTPAMSADAKWLRETAEAAAAGADGGQLFRRMAPTTFSASWLRKQSPDFLELRARQVAAMPRPFFAGGAAILGIVETFDVTPYFDRIEAPTLILAAEHDELFPIAHSRAIAAGIRGARLEVVHDSGHAAVVEQGGRVAELVVEFIDSV
jgi:3-oxoadipate enol-lactonase